LFPALRTGSLFARFAFLQRSPLSQGVAQKSESQTRGGTDAGGGGEFVMSAAGGGAQSETDDRTSGGVIDDGVAFHYMAGTNQSDTGSGACSD
jgi:hypothetical protein